MALDSKSVVPSHLLSHFIPPPRHAWPHNHFCKTKLRQSIQTTAKKQAEDAAAGALKEIETMDGSFASLFPYKTLTEATTAFSSEDVAKPNELLVKALAATQEAVDTTITRGLTMERYILLTIPKMEDGNNFGVTVQLAALKHMQDDRDKLQKILEDLSKYAATRADAMEKCKLPSSSKAKTTTSSQSNNDTKGGEKPGTTTSTSTNTEEKTTETQNQQTEAAFRQQAVWSVDALYYSKARTGFMTALTAYSTAIDFMDKNQEKISAPKGSESGRGYTSMY